MAMLMKGKDSFVWNGTLAPHLHGVHSSVRAAQQFLHAAALMQSEEELKVTLALQPTRLILAGRNQDYSSPGIPVPSSAFTAIT